jgi:Undecaprenyl-phosphate glucose phosphotransferase
VASQAGVFEKADMTSSPIVRSSNNKVVALKASVPASTSSRKTPLWLVALLLDAAIIVGLTLAVPFLYHATFGTLLPNRDVYLLSAFVLAAVFCTVTAVNEQYDIRVLESPQSIFAALRYLNIIFAMFISVLFLTYATDVYSRATLLLQYVALSIGLPSGRAILIWAARRAMRNGGIAGKRVVLIGCDHDLNDLRQNNPMATTGVSIVRTFEVPHWAMSDLGPNERAKLDALARQWIADLRLASIDDIVLLLPWRSAATADALTRQLATLPTAAIHLATDHKLTWFRRPDIARIGGLLTLRISRPPLNATECALKRLIDIVLASITLVALSPFMVLVAVAIKADSQGPVFFRQRRYGFNQNPFHILKFRTMNCLQDGDVVPQARPNDPRVTRIGRLLRRLSLDELPQLFNVLRGEMSLIGPRPHAITHDHEFVSKIALYAHRHNVKPGLTGWAQVNGFRGETDENWKMQRRVDHDLYYIDNWSLSFDFKIVLLTTIRIMIFNKNVY